MEQIKSFLPGLIVGLSVLLSPDHLRLWGNLAGRNGLFCLAVIAAAMLVFWPSARHYRTLADDPSTGGYPAGRYRRGGVGMLALLTASRLVLTTGLSTGVLVTAGFVFNETFLYWFPNFGFAFMGLAAAALPVAWGGGAARRMQTVFALTAVAALATLMVWGIGHWPVPAAEDGWPAPGVTVQGIAGGLLLFAGFDMAVHRDASARAAPADFRSMRAVLAVAVLLFGAWSVVSLLHVPAQRLSDSFIPFILAARAIGGQAGRVLMGIVVIAGAMAAVTVLLTATSRLIGDLSQLNLLPGVFRGSRRRNVPATLLLTVAVAAMMALGFAGSPALEIFIRAGMLLWLIHLGIVHLLAWAGENLAKNGGPVKWSAWLELLAPALMGLGGATVWLLDAQRMHLLAYMLAAWSATAATLLVCTRAGRQAQRPGNRRAASGR